MQKLLYIAVAAIVALSSCSDENVIDNENDSNKVNAQVFTATIEGDEATRTTLATGSSDGQKKVNWSDGDQISVNGSLYSTTSTTNTADFTLVDGEKAAVAKSGYYKAYYPAALYNSGTPTLPASYDYVSGQFNLPMYAQSKTTELGFKNICGVLAITVPSSQMTSVSSIVVSSDKQMNGALSSISTAGVLKFKSKTLAAADKKVTLTCNASGSNTTISQAGKTFYVAIPPQTYGYLQIEVTDGTVTKTMKTTAGAEISVARNSIYPIAFAEPVDPNLLNGVFTVNAAGKKVKFTKGNLYWNGSKYCLEEQQYNFKNTWDAHHVSHFYWNSATEHKYGYMQCGQKYKVTDESTEDKFFCCEQSPMTVEGTSGLFALTYDEWYYLIQTRPTSKRKFGVTVTNGSKTYSNCLIIAPDEFTGTLSSSYTLDEVNSLGLVCLPAAGYRKESTFTKNSGYYWTSTPSAKNTSGAWLMHFDDSEGEFGGYTRANYAVCVRLVSTQTTADRNLLAGSFSVAANKKVRFTKGNLYWNGSTFAFEANQTDSQTQFTSKHVSHFYWTKNTCFLPYAKDYNYYIQSTSSKFFCGEENPLTVEGTSGLYALTKDEWLYILNSRNQTNRCAKARVNNVPGVLIFPDNYNGTTTGTGINTENTDDVYFPAESINTEIWSAMESAGVVFLPLTDHRQSDIVFDSDEYIRYWSSTLNTNDAVQAFYIQSLSFSSSLANRDDHALPIRLVK